MGGAALAGTYALGLTGCGGDAGGNDNGFDFLAAQYSNPTTAFWEDMIADFTDENPDAEVGLQVVGWDALSRQVNSQVTTGQPPDLLNFNTYATYAADGLLVPAEEVISSELRDNFYENFYRAGQIEGQLYGIPFLASIRNLYYNAQIFEQAGIERPPRTWDELVETAQKIQDETGINGFGVPMTEFEGQAYFSYFIWGNGGDWKTDGEWSFNIPENVEALQFLADLVNEHEVTNSDPTTINRDELQRVFGAGELGMMITANFFPTILADEAPDLDYGVGPIPVNEGVEEFSLGVQDFLMVFDNGSDLDTISGFLDFFYQDERYQQFMEQEGFLPATQSAGESMATEVPESAQFIEQLPLARFYPLQDPQLDSLLDDVTAACQQVLSGDRSPKEALDDLQRRAEEG